MRVRVNGDERVVPPETTVAGLLDLLGLGGRPVVVERSGVIVSREAFAATLLAEGDALEIVRLVGGG